MWAAPQPFLACIIINSKHSRVQAYYCFGHALTILLFITNFAAKIAPDAQTKWGLIAATCLLKLVFDISFVLYINAFYKPVRRTVHLAVVAFYLTAGITVILTNPWHHLFVSDITASSVVYGALYYVIMGAGFAFEIVGMLCIIQYWVKRLDNPQFRTLASLVALTGILFMHGSLLNVFKMQVDVIPLLIAAGFALYFIGASKYSMFDAISYNSVHGLELFTDALLIVDRKGKVVYKNRSCELLDGNTLQAILDRFSFQPDHGKTEQKEVRTELELAKPDGTKYYTVTVKPIKRTPLASGKSVYIIHDNTKYVSEINALFEKKQYLQELNDSTKTMWEDSKRLAVLRERNLLANEIHDVVGHALILALNTMESNKLLTDRSVAMGRIKQAVTEIGVIVKEMELTRQYEPSEQKENEKPSSVLLAERLAALETRLSDAGVDLEVTAVDNFENCQKCVVNGIYRICQESVTNAIKHGNAGRIAISIKQKSDIIELFVLDNGRGCTDIVKGTGLTSMEYRVQKLGGTINFSSFEDQAGFMVRAGIPTGFNRAHA